VKMETDLKSCPFCGSIADSGYEGFCAPDYLVRCLECDASVQGENELHAIEKWNRRTISAGESQ
jgi:Lar family restriction alleviation protein